MSILAVGEALWDVLPAGPRLGGAPLNFAIQCCKFGHRAVIASRVGADPLGSRLIEEASGMGIDVACLQSDEKHPTGTVDIEIDHQGLPTYAIARPVAYDFLEWNDRLAQTAAAANYVCFGTLAQRELSSRETTRRILASTSAIKILDLNLRHPLPSNEVVESSLKACQWLKINEDELRFLKRWLGVSCEEHVGTLERIRREFAIDLVALTLGPRGCHVQSPGEEAIIAGMSVVLSDTVGAGDAFLAGLVVAIDDGRPLREAATFANRHAAQVLSQSHDSKHGLHSTGC